MQLENDSDFEAYLASLQDFNQHEQNDLTKDPNLSKQSSGSLASRLNEKNLIYSDTDSTFYRNRNKAQLRLFSWENNLIFCNDIRALLAKLVWHGVILLKV